MSILWAMPRFFFRILRRLERLSNIRLATNSGMKVGSNTRFVGMQQFGSEPFLIDIGKDCLVTDGVRFITHDGSIQVPLIAAGQSFSDVYSKSSTFGRIVVGDNVFIGVNSVILPGTVIRDNSIVAAGSVVKGVFEHGSVVGGNPAKWLCSVDDYYAKNSCRILKFTNEKSRVKQIIEFI